MSKLRAADPGDRHRDEGRSDFAGPGNLEDALIDFDDLVGRSPVSGTGATSSEETAIPDGRAETETATLFKVPFTPNLVPKKGVLHAPDGQGQIDPRERDALLQAIVRARGWMDAIIGGKAVSFEGIATAEGLGERHVRFLAPLAFTSPRVIEAIANQSVPAGTTASALARTLPHSWAEQERKLGLR